MRRLATLVAASLLALAAPAHAGELRVVDLQTGAVSVPAPGAHWSAPVWRADGTLLAARSDGAVEAFPGGVIARLPDPLRVAIAPAGDRLAVLPARRSRLEVRTTGGLLLGAWKFDADDNSLAWSPDGNRLAFGWFDHRLRDHLTVLGPRGHALRTFDAPDDVTVTPASWAPDDRSLVYLDEPERDPAKPLAPAPENQLRRLDVITGAQHVLFRGDRCEHGFGAECELVGVPKLSAAGRVAFVRNFAAVALLEPPVEFRQSGAEVFDVAWMPGGTTLLEASVRPDHHVQLALVGETPPFLPTPVADVGHIDVEGLTVSPDGTRAAFVGETTWTSDLPQHHLADDC
jgi:hypothetical protein